MITDLMLNGTAFHYTGWLMFPIKTILVRELKDDVQSHSSRYFY